MAGLRGKELSNEGPRSPVFFSFTFLESRIMARRQLYLLHSNEHCALLYLPRGMASEDYERLRGFFGRFVNASDDDFVSITKLHTNDCREGIWYTGELAGPGGMSYQVFQLPKQTDEAAKACERYLRINQDVVRLKVIKFKRDHSIDIQIISNRMFSKLHDFGTWHAGQGNGEGSVFADEGRMQFESGHGTTLSPICQVCDFEGDKELLINLISASPELLRDLETLVNWCRQMQAPSEMLARAERSISKARGESLPQ